MQFPRSLCLLTATALPPSAVQEWAAALLQHQHHDRRWEGLLIQA